MKSNIYKYQKKALVNFIQKKTSETVGVFCFGSLEVKPLSYYDTNTRGIILTKYSVNLADVFNPANDWEPSEELLYYINEFLNIEELIVKEFAYIQTNPNYYRMPATMWDLASKIRTSNLEYFRDSARCAILSVIGFIDRYFEQYKLLVDSKYTPSDVVKVLKTDEGDYVIGEFNFKTFYKLD